MGIGGAQGLQELANLYELGMVFNIPFVTIIYWDNVISRRFYSVVQFTVVLASLIKLMYASRADVE